MTCRLCVLDFTATWIKQKRCGCHEQTQNSEQDQCPANRVSLVNGHGKFGYNTCNNIPYHQNSSLSAGSIVFKAVGDILKDRDSDANHDIGKQDCGE